MGQAETMTLQTPRGGRNDTIVTPLTRFRNLNRKSSYSYYNSGTYFFFFFVFYTLVLWESFVLPFGF